MAFVAAAPCARAVSRAPRAACRRAPPASPTSRPLLRVRLRARADLPDAVPQPDGVYEPGVPRGHDGSGAPAAAGTASEVGGAAAAAAAAGGSSDYPGGGGGGGGGPGKGGSGGGGEEEKGEGEGSDGSLPPDMRAALAFGSLGRDGVSRYRAGLRNPLLALCLALAPFRTRFLADPAFLFKLVVQEAVGNGTALASEIAVRGRDIVHELEYVASDLIVGTVIEAGFVWVLAPRLATAASADGSRNWVMRALAALPSHMFQPDAPGRLFSPGQRLGAFAYGAAQYGLIGFAAGVVGTAITYGLLEARKLLDKSYVPERAQPAVLPNAAGWAAFMVLSANTRFQLVEGLELGVARMFKGSDAMRNVGIVVLRLANNYWGGVQFVKFFRFLGLHATGEDEKAEIKKIEVRFDFSDPGKDGEAKKAE